MVKRSITIPQHINVHGLETISIEEKAGLNVPRQMKHYQSIGYMAFGVHFSFPLLLHLWHFILAWM